MTTFASASARSLAAGEGPLRHGHDAPKGVPNRRQVVADGLPAAECLPVDADLDVVVEELAVSRHVAGIERLAEGPGDGERVAQPRTAVLRT